MDENEVKKIISHDASSLASTDFQNSDNENNSGASEETPKIQNDVAFEEKVSQNTKPHYNIESALFLFFSIFGIVFVALTFVFQIILTPIKVVGESMQPTINASVLDDSDEEHNDIVYYMQQSSYDNYDIVIISNANKKYVDDSKVNYLIKRVIATGGQTIRFVLGENFFDEYNNFCYYYTIEVLDSNGVDINFDDSFILEDMYFIIDWSRGEYVNIYGENFETYQQIFYGMLTSSDNVYEFAVAEGTYFVMGDNRNNSEDSRYFGAVDAENICGAVKLIIPYGKTIFQATILSKKFNTV